MTKRAVLGGTTQFSTKALYVSQNSDNVDSITKPMEFHPGMASGMHVFYYTQGTVNAPALGSESSVTITHNWGNTGSHGTNDRPLFAMRWSYPHEIVNGEATACYPPVIYEGENVEEDSDSCEEDEESGEETCEQYSIYITEGATAEHLNKNQIKIENYMYGNTDDQNETQSGEKVLYYALLVFYEHDWTGGKGL